jgi:hypothetical protein
MISGFDVFASCPASLQAMSIKMMIGSESLKITANIGSWIPGFALLHFFSQLFFSPQIAGCSNFYLFFNAAEIPGEASDLLAFLIILNG